jgi:hypothetical protein
MRVPLKPKPVQKTSSLKKLKARIRIIKHKCRLIRRLERKIKGNATVQTWYDSIPKKILPSRIDVYETHVEFNRDIIGRSIVIGGNRGDNPNFPPWISSKAFEEIIKLGNTKKCKITISETLRKKPSSKSLSELQDAYRDVNKEQIKIQMNDPAGTADLGLLNAKQDIEESYREGWERSENAFVSQMVITIKGSEEEVMNAESLIIAKLDSELIKWWYPEDLQWEAFIAGGMFPVSEPKFYIEVPSTLAAKLVAMTNINTRYDQKGMYFGKARDTNANVVKDLNRLPAKHLMMFGSTGSGKTFSSQVLLMRMKDILNHRIVYITNKAPDRRKGAFSDYEATANFYKDDANITVIGEKGKSINPLQILYNEKYMLPSDYPYVWDATRRGTSAFFKNLFGKDWTPNMEGLLEDNLDEVYEKAKVYRNKPESWKRKHPNMEPLRDKWLYIMSHKEEYSAEDRRTAAAMYRKTRGIKRGGSMEYLLDDANLELKDWMVFRLDKADERIQDALYILITSKLSLLLNIDSSKDTIVFVDEARAFIQDPETGQFLLNAVTKWRSRGVGLWLSTQQPADLKKSGMEEEFSTNMFISIVLGHKLTTKTVRYVQDFFELPDSVASDLLTCGQGEGILIIGDEGMQEITPIRFEPTPLENDVINNRYSEDRALPLVGYRLYDVFNKKGIDGKNFVERNHFFFKNMIEEGDEAAVLAEGWQKHQVPLIMGKNGTTNIYYHPGTLDWDTELVTAPDLGYGTMKIDHLNSVLQKATWHMLRGHRVTVNHNNYADLVFEITGADGKIRVYASDYETVGTHDSEELNKKWGKLQKYDDYRFVTVDVDALRAKGNEKMKIVKRGKNYVDWVISLEKLAAPADDSMSQNNVKEEESDEQENVTSGDVKYAACKVRLRDLRAKRMSADIRESEVVSTDESEIGAS